VAGTSLDPSVNSIAAAVVMGATGGNSERPKAAREEVGLVAAAWWLPSEVGCNPSANPAMMLSVNGASPRVSPP
jgi:hypothetical protein